MKKLIALALALVCVLGVVGCGQKAVSGSEVYSFPEPTKIITGSFYSQGQETAFKIGSEEYDLNDLSTTYVIKWFYDLKLTACDEPETVEGSESYRFYVKGEKAFTYEDRGSEAYIIIGGNYYKVSNPSAPPINNFSEFEATVLEVTDHYLLVEPIEGSIELNSSDEIKVGLQEKTSWPIPQVGEIVRVVYDGLIQETDPARIPNPYRVEIIISDENDTIQFHDKVFSKSELSQETIEWLEKYNELSETEQLSISSIPTDLYKLCGYGEGENTDVSAPTE